MSAEQTHATALRQGTVPWGRAVFLGVSVGVAVVVVAAVLGRPLVGLFGCIGLALGALNFYLMRRSVQRYLVAAAPVTKKQMAFSSLSRLIVITALAIACAMLVRPDGIAIFVGLAAFQLMIGARTAVSAVKELRR
jgi:hypothetical protein